MWSGDSVTHQTRVRWSSLTYRWLRARPRGCWWQAASVPGICVRYLGAQEANTRCKAKPVLPGGGVKVTFKIKVQLIVLVQLKCCSKLTGNINGCNSVVYVLTVFSVHFSGLGSFNSTIQTKCIIVIIIITPYYTTFDDRSTCATKEPSVKLRQLDWNQTSNVMSYGAVWSTIRLQSHDVVAVHQGSKGHPESFPLLGVLGITQLFESLRLCVWNSV